MRAAPLALVLATVLPGCAEDPELGMVIDRTIAQQAVDMHPQYAGVPAEASNGERSAAAMARYRSGKVKALTLPKSSSVSSGGSTSN